ncbi:MAG TPA: flavodoxin domain-containing protein [bacterium]|nr:flavodoxin domain-containing protein [bacterium]
MSRILIAYATGEGQTARIADTLANQFHELGHAVEVAHLTGRGLVPDPAMHDAVIVAASVHAGRHQKHALRFVRRYLADLRQRSAAFISVSGMAAATKPAGLQQAAEQVETFLRQADWHPAFVETVAGAFRPSLMGRAMRLGMRLMQKLARKDLDRLGWPADLSHDQEFTDWVALRRFGERFATALPTEAAAAPPLHVPSAAVPTEAQPRVH